MQRVSVNAKGNAHDSQDKANEERGPVQPATCPTVPDSGAARPAPPRMLPESRGPEEEEEEELPSRRKSDS